MRKKSRTYRRTPEYENSKKKKNYLRQKEVYKNISKRDFEEMIYENDELEGDLI